MATRISRLRRWFALGAILMIATVAGMYFYAQWSLRRAVRALPAKIGLDIQQTAEGFSISKSVEGRTLFKVSASKAVQFKEGARADLHNVKIVIYGRDASRFDQITGDEFEYDPVSGEVNAKGRVLIDLQANPEGLRHADQSAPEQLKEPIHLETNGLSFNKNTGDASASGKVEFRTPQAFGSAVGMQYYAKTGTMNLLAAVVLTVERAQPVHLEAERGVITKQPHQVFLTRVHMTREQQEMRSDQATFFLREDNTVERILAEGDVESEIHGRGSAASKAAGSRAAGSASGPQTSGSETHERSDRAELFLTGTRNLLTEAILSGDVQMDSLGAQPAHAAAGQATLRFEGEQILKTIHAEDGVRLSQKNYGTGGLAGAASVATSSSASSLSSTSASASSSSSSSASAKGGEQDVDMTAPVMDFVVKDGRLLERADTSGPPQIVITQPGANQKTVVTAAKFTAGFTEKNRLATLHGEPDARIVSSLIDASKGASNQGASNQGAPSQGVPSEGAPRKGGAAPQGDRVSTSRMLDVVFLPEGGVSSITQTGALTYFDGPQKAWAERGEYTAADQMLVLHGSPRVVNGGMTTTAQTIRMNRATGDGFAEGNVKSTYSELKAQPEGGMLASSDPIHVTSRSMTTHRPAAAQSAQSAQSAIAVYTGDARLWQNANMVEAPVLQFDQDHRSLVAYGALPAEGTGLRPGAGHTPATTQDRQISAALAQPVSTVLVEIDKTGKVTPIHITSARLHYVDGERRVFLDGGVTAKATDATMTAERMTVLLLPRSESNVGTDVGTNVRANPAGTRPARPGQIDRIIAEDRVVITQPGRHGSGERMVYTAADDRFVLTGGNPSIFDAERGKTSGDSLTFYRHDDRVLVEGRETSPTITRTQVAR